MTSINRRNIREQGVDAKARIRATATSFKDNASKFPWLIELLQAQSVPVERGILVAVSHLPEPSGDQYEGTWLTLDKRFFEFSVVVPRTHAGLEIEEWQDVTAETVVSQHLPGTGRSFGFLALEVLSELRG